MPFSSQPRKKGTPSSSQDGSIKPSCGHSVPQLSCKECPPPRSSPKDVPQTNNHEEKQKLLSLREKIADKFLSDPRAAEKAAIIISDWINNKKSKK